MLNYELCESAMARQGSISNQNSGMPSNEEGQEIRNADSSCIWIIYLFCEESLTWPDLCRLLDRSKDAFLDTCKEYVARQSDFLRNVFWLFTFLRRHKIEFLSFESKVSQVFKPGDKVAIVGDGKLGLLVAQLTALYCSSHDCPPPLHIGRHKSKLELVQGTESFVLAAGTNLEDSHKQANPLSDMQFPRT